MGIRIKQKKLFSFHWNLLVIPDKLLALFECSVDHLCKLMTNFVSVIPTWAPRTLLQKSIILQSWQPRRMEGANTMQMLSFYKYPEILNSENKILT